MSWLFRRFNKASTWALREVPGPTPSWPIGNALRFLGRHSWDVIADTANEFGPLSVVWIFSSPSVIPVDPTLIDEVLTSRKLDFYKDSPCKAQRPILSDQHPFIANYPEWPEVAARSPMGMKSFHTWIEANVPIAASQASKTLGELNESPSGRKLEATDLIRRVMFRQMCTMILGHEISWDDYRHLSTLGDIGTQRMSAILPIDEAPNDKKFRNAFRAWRKLHEQAVREARSEPLDGRIDMLAFAVRDGSELDDFRLAAEMASRYFGGMYSSSVGAVNTLYCLSNHPRVLEALRAEVRPLFEGDGYDLGQLRRCALLDAVVRESLRLFAPIPVFLRRSDPVREVRLGAARLPPGTSVFLSPWASMRHESNWDDAMRWRPERWTDEVKEDNPYGSGRFWPFGQGPRACSGQAWSLLLIWSVVAEVVANWDFEVGVGQPWKGENYFACASPKGWRWRMARRTPQGASRAV